MTAHNSLFPGHKDMRIKLMALGTIVTMVIVTLLMRAALEWWPVGLVGTVSRVFTIAALGVLVLSAGKGWRRLLPRGMGPWLLLNGVIATALNLLLFGALKWTTATNHALLYRLDVVFVILSGSILGLERIGWRELALLPLMLLGVAMVAEIGPAGLQMHAVGDLMVVGAAVAFATNAFVVRRILRAMDAEALALVNVVLTIFGFIGLMLLDGELARVGEAMWDPIVWLWVVLLGLVFALFVPLYYATLDRMPVWKLRMWMLSAPVLVAVADWAIWDTRLTTFQCVGMGLVLLGLAGLIRLERNGGFVLRQPSG